MDDSTDYVVKITADVSDAKKGIEETEEGLDDLQKKSGNLGNIFSNLGKRLGALGKGIGSAFSSSFGAGFSQDVTDAINQQAEDARKVAEAQQETAQTAQGVADAVSDVVGRTDEAARSGSRLASIWQSIFARSGARSPEAAELREQIAEITEEMERLSEQKIPTEDFDVLEQKIADTQAKIEALNAECDELRDLGIAEQSYYWQDLKQQIAEASEQLRNYTEMSQTEGVGYTMGSSTEAYQQMDEMRSEMIAELDEVSHTGQSLLARIFIGAAKIGPKIFLGSLKVIGSAVVSIGKKIGEWAKQHASVNAAAKKLYGTFTSLFRMLKTRMKRMVVSAIFNDIKESFRAIAQISPEFNEAVSGMMSSCRRLGTQLVASLAPAIEAIAPYVVKLVDLLSEGAAKIAQFVSTLFGKSTFLSASKGQYDYAASLDKSAKSASKAAKANDEMKRSVMSFDELNKLSDNDDEESAGVDDNQLAELEVKANSLVSIAQRIRDAFKTGDWSGVGSAIGDFINKPIAMLKDLTDPSKHDFGAMGRGLGETITGIFDSIDWGAAGQSIMNGIMGIIRFINGVISTPGFWKGIGNAIKKFIEGLMDAFDPVALGQLVINLINGLNEMIINLFSDRAKIKEFTDKLVEFINEILTGLDWDMLVDAINAISEGLVNVISSLLESLFTKLDWAALGKFVVNALIAAVETAINPVIAIINGILDVISGVGQAIGLWGDIGHIPNLEIPKLAGGGVIGNGQLFIANEGGAMELIGGDGHGNTAVMNNEQIISAVSAGVRDAVIEAAMIVMSNTDDDTGDDGDVEFRVRFDSEELATVVRSGERRINKRVNPRLTFA